MDTTNNFKKLAAEDEKHIPYAPKKVEQRVMGTVKSGQFVGDVLELYFSKMIDLVLMIFGKTNSAELPVEDPEDNAGEVR